MDSLLPVAMFAFVASITPGPNNAMLSASGVAFGLRRTLPHVLGVSVGFTALLVLCASGVGALVIEFPTVALGLKVLGSLYLLYLAWIMRNALDPTAASAVARPMRFREAVLFQFVNPKGWMMAVTVASVFVPDTEPRWLAVAIVCGLCALINLPCIWTWAVLGVTVRRWLAHDRWRRVCSGTVVVLMVYSVVAMWI
jgi:threonine/homoserine/homoserine lactone efflux protein